MPDILGTEKAVTDLTNVALPKLAAIITQLVVDMNKLVDRLGHIQVVVVETHETDNKS